MKILIATPLYPPDIGGPAQYAYNLEREFKNLGHKVRVKKFSDIKHLPSGLRHFIYFCKILPAMFWTDWCLALDTFSVALPVVLAAKLFGKKTIIRIGGDFLWEQYVERTGKLILLRNFYQTELEFFSKKEKIIFRLTKWILHHATTIVFSTDWQRQIWRKPYKLNLAKTVIVENYYNIKELSFLPSTKNFLWAGRYLKLKNLDYLKQAFISIQLDRPDLSLEIGQWSPQKLEEKIKTSYAVIVPSISEISPNLILSAVNYGKPFILTLENGINNRLEEIALLVDPINIEDIKNKIIWLADEQNYLKQQKKIINFSFIHSWSKMASEFLAIPH
ncbi:MAG: glycosyltransferase family 4 protein [Patescibacteria group bacterium]